MSYPEEVTLQSNDPRKVWKLSVYKPQGRPAYATAIEGEVDTSAAGYSVFRFELDPTKLSRTATKVAINGPATKKKREAALRILEVQLREAGLLRDPKVDAQERMADIVGGEAALSPFGEECSTQAEEAIEPGDWANF